MTKSILVVATLFITGCFAPTVERPADEDGTEPTEVVEQTAAAPASSGRTVTLVQDPPAEEPKVKMPTGSLGLEIDCYTAMKFGLLVGESSPLSGNEAACRGMGWSIRDGQVCDPKGVCST